MAYILTEQLHDDETGDTAFQRYQAYLAEVRDRMPPSAFALATSDWYFNSTDHRSPHDARLERCEILESSDPSGDRSVAIVLRLLGAYDDGHIELRYAGVRRYRVELQATDSARGGGHVHWRYDEFRVAASGGVEHEIEWWGRYPTATWLIEAADVTYRWYPLPAAPAPTSSVA